MLLLGLEPFKEQFLVNAVVVLVVGRITATLYVTFMMSKGQLVYHSINIEGSRSGESREEKDLVAVLDGVPAAADHVVAHLQPRPLLHLLQPGREHEDHGALNL